MTTIRSTFPRPVREIENLWIPLADGTQLAGRLWLPEDATENPVPALLEYIPYRKSDYTAIRDATRQPYFAGHGYAVLRVDLRGSGDSDGVLLDEYLPQELADAVEVIAWLAQQPWCTGDVGMMGISWGGFNSLQVAALRPPALKAIIAIGCTDDRYADDVHYMGGCVLTSQMLPWAALMFVYNAAPPDPRHVGERWREMWQERLESNTHWGAHWLAHQRRDAYWQHGSVGEDYSAIQIPVYVVGGWADSYNNSVPRLLAHLPSPRQGLIGPWVHTFPEQGEPAPAIGFLQESLRWWDYWLKGIETGITAEPMLRTWMQKSVPPAPAYAERPGYWVADPAWPSPHVAEQPYFLNSDGAVGTLDETAAPATNQLIFTRQGHGLHSAEWGSYGALGEAPPDQRPLDGEAVSFTTPPATAAVAILGRPTVRLTLAADQPVASIAVRLCDVAPDGRSLLVSWGLLNLTHRESHAAPTPLEPGVPYTITVPLNMVAHELPVGHRWRVALSSTLARHIWPAPYAARLTLTTGAASQLLLPVRPPQPADGHLPPFPEPEIAPPLPLETLRPDVQEHTITYDAARGISTLRLFKDAGRVRLPGNGLEWDDISTETFTIQDDEPLSAAHEIEAMIEYQRDAWRVRLLAHSKLTADATHFYLTCQLEGYEGTTRVFARNWAHTIPRDLV